MTAPSVLHHGRLRSCLWPRLVTAIALTSGCASIDASAELTDADATPLPDARHGGDAPGIDDAGGGPGGLPACPTFAGPSAAGLVTHLLVTEASGVVASRRNPGVLWVHNDSGDSARIFAISTTGGALGTFSLMGANANDWEDIAAGPGPVSGQSYLYIGDVGDNGESRANIKL